MSPLWSPDIEVTSELAARLISAQFPEIRPGTIAPFGVGWDNQAYLVNGALVFRFPCRKSVAGLLTNESLWLPKLGPHLPLPVPQPVYVGNPTEDYPYTFAGYAAIAGTTACRLTWSPQQRIGVAPTLARFLSALHAIEIDSDAALAGPRDEIKRTDLVMRARQFRERLTVISARLEEMELDAVRIAELADTLAETSRSSLPLCWVHGDLYARHLLADDRRRLTGVIDWGDLHLGDRALDLSIAYSFLPPEARGAFLDAYGPIDDDTLKRAQFKALYYGAILMIYGADVGDLSLVAAGEYALINGLDGRF